MRGSCLPHVTYNALEAHEQHRGGKVYGLIWLLLVALSRLARTQESKKSVGKSERHESRNCEQTVPHHEAAFQRVPRILVAVAGKVKNR